MKTTDKSVKAIIEHGIDNLDSLIDYPSNVHGCDLHNSLYNEDYFIIGTYQAKEFLKKYGTFDAIEKIQEYEESNFGEVNTKFSDPENIVNMLAYIVGEEALNECPTLQKTWDVILTKANLKAIKKELQKQL